MRATTGHILVGVLVGLVVDIATYTFVYARGYAYLTNDPEACTNCHVMQEQYSGWTQGSHQAVAKCNDCHTPHNLAGKYAVKAANGFFHSLAFTTGRFPDSIQIKGYNRSVTEAACRTCHGEMTSSIAGVHGGKDISCLRCHANVGHSAAPMSIASISPVSSAVPNATGAPSREGNHNGYQEQR